jgi:hypothetical protein
MLILLTDETNLPSDPKAKFFVYGGLIFKADALPSLDRAIAEIRLTAGYLPDDELKFATASRPDYVTLDAVTETKNSVVDACIAHDCVFIAYAVLHAIARNKTQDELIHIGANHVIGKFNRYCFENGDYGICLVDRLPGTTEYRYLTDKFTKGLEFDGEDNVRLDRVKLFGATCSNASHISSAVDIVLGCFRYCINEPSNLAAAEQMMANVTRMIWHVRKDDTLYVGERGLIMRPKTIKVSEYQAEYDTLIDSINRLIEDQDI